MTQEFVAESLGVSRQAVSKWENGTSDPSTSNLFALAKLFGVSVEELYFCKVFVTRTFPLEKQALNRTLFIIIHMYFF